MCQFSRKQIIIYRNLIAAKTAPRQAGRKVKKSNRCSKPFITYALVALIGISGCAKETPYNKPIFKFRNSYAGANRASPLLLQNEEWWKALNDPTLNTLIQKGLKGNLSIAAAKERIVEARYNLQSVPPHGTATPSASIQRRNELDGSPQTRTTASLGFSWMLDPFGTRKSLIRAAGGRLDVADAEVDAARLLMIYNIANTYTDLRFQQRLLSLRQQQLRSRHKVFALTQSLFDHKSATRLDVVQSQALVAETQAQIPGVQAEILKKKYELAVLVGETPGSLNAMLEKHGHQLRPNMSPKVGIPVDLLRNRPDIRIAERLYYTAVAEIEVSRAALYPRLSLGGSIGLASIGSSSGTEYFFGPTIQLPSLPTGSNKARVAAAHSRAKQAHISWKKTVLSAVLEVESGLKKYAANAASVQSSSRSSRLYREAVGLTRDLVEKDEATIRELIDAEEKIAVSDVVLAENRRQLAQSFIALNISLGAGHAAHPKP